MGNSTIDIPPDLLFDSACDRFLTWVRVQQAPESAKRYLISTWRKNTKVLLRKADYDYALNKSAPAI